MFNILFVCFYFFFSFSLVHYIVMEYNVRTQYYYRRRMAKQRKQHSRVSTEESASARVCQWPLFLLVLATSLQNITNFIQSISYNIKLYRESYAHTRSRPTTTMLLYVRKGGGGPYYTREERLPTSIQTRKFIALPSSQSLQTGYRQCKIPFAINTYSLFSTLSLSLTHHSFFHCTHCTSRLTRQICRR